MHTHKHTQIPFLVHIHPLRFGNMSLITQVFLYIFIAAFLWCGLILLRDVGGGHKYLVGIGRGKGRNSYQSVAILFLSPPFYDTYLRFCV